MISLANVEKAVVFLESWLGDDFADSKAFKCRPTSVMTHVEEVKRSRCLVDDVRSVAFYFV